MDKLNHIALLIDADNVSIDVTRQVLQRLDVPGARLQHRRAYGSVSKALEFAEVCRDHAIRFLPSTFAGPNATDIAMAIDAVELVLRQPVDEVVIVSSDMDYSPLIVRLRELGCRVCGFGQQGKSGRDVERDYERVYDQFTVMAPSNSAKPRAAGRPAAKTGVPRAVREPASKPASTAMALVVPSPSLASSLSSPLPGGRAQPTPLRAVGSPAVPPVLAAVRATGPAMVAPTVQAPGRAAASRRRPAAKKPPMAAAAVLAGGLPSAVEAVLNACPDLRSGVSVRLNGVAVALRERGLLTKSGKTTAFFKKLESHFALLPADKPESVCFLGVDFDGG